MLKNGEVWLDTNGNPIHAHGGWILKVGDWFYWYGEDRRDNHYVACYRTCDFKKFEFRNYVLNSDSKIEPLYYQSPKLSAEKDICDGQYQHGGKRIFEDKLLVNIERPKVVYCEKTKKYVMWMHYENGFNYMDAACAVATCDTPDGDFVYHGHFRPFNNMSRDCTVFSSGEKVYFASAANDNADLVIYRMTEDCLGVEEQVKLLFKGQLREAPAFFEKDGDIFLLTSYCTGWEPNQGKFSRSKNGISGDWSMLSNFGDETTFESQPAFVFKTEKDGMSEYYYFGDRWGGNQKGYMASSYVVLKIKFRDDGSPYIDYSDIAQMPEI